MSTNPSMNVYIILLFLSMNDCLSVPADEAGGPVGVSSAVHCPPCGATVIAIMLGFGKEIEN